LGGGAKSPAYGKSSDDDDVGKGRTQHLTPCTNLRLENKDYNPREVDLINGRKDTRTEDGRNTLTVQGNYLRRHKGLLQRILTPDRKKNHPRNF
jgi:hypothetical protein